MREFINIVENASRDNHYTPLEDLIVDHNGGGMRKYRIEKTGETLVVSVSPTGTDDDGDRLFTVTAYIHTDGSLTAIGNGRVVVADGDAYFSNIAVAPDYRRMGIATAMYDQIEDMGYSLDMSPGEVFPDARNMWGYRSGRNSIVETISEDAEATFLGGSCGSLALAIHNVTGWPARASQNHVWVVNPEGNAVDVRGVHEGPDAHLPGDEGMETHPYKLSDRDRDFAYDEAREIVANNPEYFGIL